MKKSGAAIACAVAAMWAITACGNPERDKSRDDIAESVRDLQTAMKDETAAVRAGDARDEVENVLLVAQVEHRKLTTLAQRAPAETQDFADAAEAWAQAVATSRAATLEQADESTSTLAFANVRLATRTMDTEAAELDIDPWLKLDQY
ncbi:MULTISPECIES: hypothetical protein [unclassified Streptomyces]|uniref:hypothetical protein n=1 Tax=unclassified Streptomyces TaxID=2593676 RepID=UPI00367C752B